MLSGGDTETPLDGKKMKILSNFPELPSARIPAAGTAFTTYYLMFVVPL